VTLSFADVQYRRSAHPVVVDLDSAPLEHDEALFPGLAPIDGNLALRLLVVARGEAGRSAPLLFDEHSVWTRAHGKVRCAPPRVTSKSSIIRLTSHDDIANLEVIIGLKGDGGHWPAIAFDAGPALAIEHLLWRRRLVVAADGAKAADDLGPVLDRNHRTQASTSGAGASGLKVTDEPLAD
jgi:hypothetical protein